MNDPDAEIILEMNRIGGAVEVRAISAGDGLEVSFTAPSNGKPEVESLKIDLHVPSAKVAAPQQVLVTGPVSAREQ